MGISQQPYFGLDCSIAWRSYIVQWFNKMMGLSLGLHQLSTPVFQGDTSAAMMFGC